MDTAKVCRTQLLAKIEDNRANHRALFLKAQEGYRRMVIEELDKMLADAREGKPIRTTIALQAPQDHTDEYDNAIEMLRMDIEEHIEISAHDFQCYVRDKWQWSAHANFLNSTYAAGLKP